MLLQKLNNKSQYLNPKQMRNHKLQITKRLLFGVCNLKFVACLGFGISILGFGLAVPTVNAVEVEALQSQIDDYSKKIEAIEREIAEQRAKIANTSAKAGALQSTIDALNQDKRALETNISKTRNIIGQSKLNIQKLSIEIDDKKDKISISNAALAQSVRSLNILDSRSFFEMLFSGNSISEFTNDVVNIEKIKKSLLHTKIELVTLNGELTQKKGEEEEVKDKLEDEQVKLESQKESVEYTKKEKDGLLAVTKNQEASYRQVLAQKERERREFEDLLIEIESELKLLIDPNSYPGARNGILSWPIDTVRITQNFGGTQFAKTNPHVYSRPFHPGTDFGVPRGTEVKSVSSGVILGHDNTDLYPGCRAWGLWTMVKHDNGLTSLYSHLSSLVKRRGERVEAGDVIALSGNSGISTGPHLHLGLYASQGVFIGKYGSQKPGGAGCSATNASGPFADLDAYLDPLEYLPGI
jgi:murein DD-endopeptidase MepM/ murein hydrolase activator NlpD